jgi:cell division protein FtsI/penicillin-binding protein 2
MGIVMDPRDASVIAVASVPGISTRHNRPYASADWRDPVVLDAFEPGSSFKLFTTASLLRHAVTDTSEIFDGGSRDPHAYRHREDMGGFYFQDVHPVGRVSLRAAFAVSSNIIFGKAVSLLRREEFADDLRRFGFGMSTSCGLPGESPGILRKPKDWSGRSQPTLAIGQEISVTLLQLAAGYSALLTDGTLRSPRLVKSWRDEDGREHVVASRVIRERIVPPHVPPILRALCRDVVQTDYGSGQAARVEGLSVGGKTGTAQVALEGSKGYADSVYIANFIGFAPAEDPQLLVAIVVNRPSIDRRWGGDTAAGCFSRVVGKVLSATRLLEHRQQQVAQELPSPRPENAEVPKLVGLSVEKAMEQLRRSGCELANEAPNAGSRVVGQMPTPGCLVKSGERVRVAWSRGGDQ